jgi:hypothetical protein
MTVPADDADVRVEIENTATPDEIQAVQVTLDEFRIPATATATLEPPPRGGLEDVPLLIELVTVYGLVKFADTFLTKATEDAYDGLKNLMGRLWSRKHRPGGYGVAITDRRSNVRVHLHPRQPAEAFGALAAFDFDTLPPGELWFDRDAGEWNFYPN